MASERGTAKRARDLTRPGDIVSLVAPHGSIVLVESLENDQIYVEAKPGDRAMIIKKFTGKTHIMINGFVGWVFDDEWSPENT